MFQSIAIGQVEFSASHQCDRPWAVTTGHGCHHCSVWCWASQATIVQVQLDLRGSYMSKQLEYFMFQTWRVGSSLRPRCMVAVQSLLIAVQKIQTH